MPRNDTSKRVCCGEDGMGYLAGCLARIVAEILFLVWVDCFYWGVSQEKIAADSRKMLLIIIVNCEL